MRNTNIYIIIMALVTFLIRIIPITFFKKQITNRFLKSFLYYVPYVMLALMTFPAIVNATQSPIAGAAALIAGIVLAWNGIGLLPVAISCCAIVFILEFFLL